MSEGASRPLLALPHVPSKEELLQFGKELEEEYSNQNITVTEWARDALENIIKNCIEDEIIRGTPGSVLGSIGLSAFLLGARAQELGWDTGAVFLDGGKE